MKIDRSSLYQPSLRVVIDVAGESYEVDLRRPHDISIPVMVGECAARSNSAPRPTVCPLEIGDFKGAVSEGASCNVDVVNLVPHCSGTHTECFGHLSQERVTLLSCLQEAFFVADLISVPLEKCENDDVVVVVDALRNALQQRAEVESLIIRTLPNSETKRIRDWSGTNPPYLELAAVEYLVTRGVRHLLLDLPSIDREVDAELLGHRTFWGLREGSVPRRKDCTITEFIYVPDAIRDGRYLLNLQVPGLPSDAAPSRALLFDLVPESR